MIANDKLLAFDINQKLYALNPNTGERLWVGSIWDSKKCYSSGLATHGAVGGDTLFINAQGGTCMYGISLSNGSIKWIIDSEKYPGAVGTFAGIPLYHNGVVYSGDGNLFAVDAATGEVLGISSDVDPGRQFTQPFLINGEIVTWGRSVTGFQPVR
jgi:outer membrane protein assembly factor BamB